MSSDKSGSPPCGIYVRIDDFTDMRKIISQLREVTLVINRVSGYEINMHVVELVAKGQDKETEERMSDLVDILQAQGLVAVISGDVDVENVMGADGVLLYDVEGYEKARQTLGEDAIIGLVCSGSKELAEAAIQREFDYVVLNADPDLIGWWQSKTGIFAAVSGHDINADNCGALAIAGAKFVDVSDYIFNHKKGAMQGAVNVLHALELAAQVPKVLN